jgi:hypothetical protein
LATLQPGESAAHVERWSLHRNVNIGRWEDSELDRVIAPLIGA